MADADAYVSFTGTLPGPDGQISTVLAADTNNAHRTTALEFFQFLRQENRLDMQLNADAKIRTALLAVPSTALVKVVYCVNLGVSGLGSTSSINGKFLVLTGEGGKELGQTGGCHDGGGPIHCGVCNKRERFLLAIATQVGYRRFNVKNLPFVSYPGSLSL